MIDISRYIENKIVNIEWDWRNEHHQKLNLEPIYERTEVQCNLIAKMRWDIQIKLNETS